MSVFSGKKKSIRNILFLLFRRFLYNVGPLGRHRLGFRVVFSHRHIYGLFLSGNCYVHIFYKTQREVTLKRERKTVDIYFGVDVPETDCSKGTGLGFHFGPRVS